MIHSTSDTYIYSVGDPKLLDEALRHGCKRPVLAISGYGLVLAAWTILDPGLTSILALQLSLSPSSR